jgi:hypothetical protein
LYSEGKNCTTPHRTRSWSNYVAQKPAETCTEKV